LAPLDQSEGLVAEAIQPTLQPAGRGLAGRELQKGKSPGRHHRDGAEHGEATALSFGEVIGPERQRRHQQQIAAPDGLAGGGQPLLQQGIVHQSHRLALHQRQSGRGTEQVAEIPGQGGKRNGGLLGRIGEIGAADQRDAVAAALQLLQQGQIGLQIATRPHTDQADQSHGCT
jgi:hypothetical protein